MGNQLSGEIPQSLSEISRLDSIDLHSNKLVGNPFPTFRSLIGVKYLHIQLNNFSGEVPAYISEMTKLSNLNIGGNRFSGELPESMGRLMNLAYFYAWSNELSGELPRLFAQLPNLKIVSIADNSFEGDIPTEFYSASIKVNSRYNNFDGPQPINFDLTDSELSWKVRPKGTARVSVVGRDLIIEFDDLQFTNTSGKTNIRGVIATMSIREDQKAQV